MDIEAMHPGPRDSSLLHLQAKHRSKEIWRVGGGDSQKFRKHNPNDVSHPALDHRMIPLLHSTGFYGVSRVSSLKLDWSLLSALVKRWRPETHTFHLPMGECTITLQDVGVLLGLPIDGAPVMCTPSPSPNMTWVDTVASIFGEVPPVSRFNGSRLQLSWFSSTTPRILAADASDDQVRHHTRCYLMQLLGGCLFTDHSGGSIHCMWVHFVRDLDAFGRYAWGPAVLAFLYRELCKGCMIDTEEVAGCLLLLQLWAWERLPTLCPIRTTQRVVDDHFWEGQLPGPHGVRWLVGHSFMEKAGRTLSVTRTILDELSPSQFIWEPYSVDTIASLPPYCLTGQHIWRYRGPMICVYIVEAHVPDRVARQFGMLQSIPADLVYSTAHHKITLKGSQLIDWSVRHRGSIDIWNTRLDHIFESALIVGDGTTPDYLDWYLERTVRFISRIGALHVYLGGLLKTIAERTESVLPDVASLATAGLHQLDHRALYGFDAFSLEDRRHREMEGRQDPGRRPKRGGRGGRGGGRRGGRRDDQVDEHHLVDDHDALFDGGGGDHFDVPESSSTFHDRPESSTVVRDRPESSTAIPDPLEPPTTTTVPHSPEPHTSVPESSTTVPDPPESSTTIPEPPEPPTTVSEATRSHVSEATRSHDWCPSFDLGLTPTPPTTSDPATTQLPPVIQPADRHSHQPVSSHPTLDPGLDVPSSQSTQSSPPERIIRVYEPRRSKRQRKATKCGTDGDKCAKHN